MLPDADNDHTGSMSTIVLAEIETDVERALTAEWVRNRASDYTQGRLALDDPKISPAFAELAGLPPLYLPVAQFDTVGQGAIALGVNALGAGVRVTLESWPGAVHGWQCLVSVGVPEAVAAFDATRQTPAREPKPRADA